MNGGGRSCSGHRAAAFDQEDVTPDAVVAAHPLAGADHPEAERPVQGEAGDVLGEDAGLDGPDARLLAGGDEGGEQRAADAVGLAAGVDVDAVLDDARVDRPAGDR